MRALVHAQLRRDHPGARIIHELPLRYSERRIDVAAIARDTITCVEIKSSRDVVDRLEGQLRGFQPISHNLIVALAPELDPEPVRVEMVGRKGVRRTRFDYSAAHDAITSAGGSIGIWHVSADAGTVKVERSHWRQAHIWPARLLETLHVAELVTIAEHHGVACGPPHVRAVAGLAQMLREPEIVRAVCWTWRRRDAFAEGTDPPCDEPFPGGRAPSMATSLFSVGDEVTR